MAPQDNLNLQIVERLTRIEEKQDTQTIRLADYHREIAGNGRPGLKQTVEGLVLWQTRVQSGWNTTIKILAWAGSAIGTVAGIVLAWMKYKHG